jgi:hypothetical protein
MTLQLHSFSAEPANYKRFVDDMIWRLDVWSLQFRQPLPGEAPQGRKFNWATFNSIVDRMEHYGLFPHYGRWIVSRPSNPPRGVTATAAQSPVV